MTNDNRRKKNKLYAHACLRTRACVRLRVQQLRLRPRSVFYQGTHFVIFFSVYLAPPPACRSPNPPRHLSRLTEGISRGFFGLVFFFLFFPLTIVSLCVLFLLLDAEQKKGPECPACMRVPLRILGPQFFSANFPRAEEGGHNVVVSGSARRLQSWERTPTPRYPFMLTGFLFWNSYSSANWCSAKCPARCRVSSLSP